jgi:uncharacterized NAD-dependent epimerase/dehydratase family protein
MRGLPDHRLPSLNDCIAVNEQMGRMVNPDCRVIGVSVNTSGLLTDRQDGLLAEIEAETGLPTVDAPRQGAGRLVDSL